MLDTAPDSPTGPRRRDAVMRREALLNAAMECFETRGYAVPLEEIADLAGVGRGTLYRNFKDRIALIMAIFERDIAEFAQDVAQPMPLEHALRSVVLRGARMTALFARMAAEVQLTDEQVGGFRALGKRAERAMEPLAQRAQAEGRLGPGVGAADLLLGVRMLSGLCKPFKRQEQIDEDLSAGLALLMRGLGPR